ncbi:MAG: hypothetical protein OXF79_02900, partial [Chloroflexi bacterium]|nr:hypothetical protein [Chloroflexota bacterium]
MTTVVSRLWRRHANTTPSSFLDHVAAAPPARRQSGASGVRHDPPGPGALADGSDRLTERSALGELLGTDFETMSMMRLYRASDALKSHRRAIEDHLFETVSDLFGLQHTVTLIDLTNTVLEGVAAKQPKARRGHSKEKRSDCPLLTLGLVLDG